MKVLMVYPNFYGMNMLPPAIGILIRCLRRQGHTAYLFDTTTYLNWHGSDNDKIKEKNLSVRPYDNAKIKQSDKSTSAVEDFKAYVAQISPDLIAFSLTEDMYTNALDLLKGLVGTNRPPVVAGGVFPTFAPELALRASYGMIDYVLIGEGEKSLPDLCRKLEQQQDVSTVEGIWFIKKDETVHRSAMPKVTDVNEDIPFPDYDLFDESRFYRPLEGKVWRMLPIETHRGCPYTCAYCNSPSQTIVYGETNQKFFRKRSMGHVREELLNAINVSKADSFMFWADTFLAWSDEEFEEFCEMYADIKLPFWIQTRPETVTEYRFRRLKDVGLFRVDFGIEHGNAQFREKVLLRKVDNDLIVKNLAIAADTGVLFAANNIMGFPNETRELAFDTIELNRRINADGANAYTFTPFHGIPLRSMAEVLGYVKRGEVAHSVLNPTMLRMPHWPQDAIEGLRRCFVLYVKLPKSRWPEIAHAEKLTPEGDKIWAQLRAEVAERYMPWSQNNPQQEQMQSM